MVRQLPPWHENLGKRQVKSPKVYVRDGGLLHSLLGITCRRSELSCDEEWTTECPPAGDTPSSPVGDALLGGDCELVDPAEAWLVDARDRRRGEPGRAAIGGRFVDERLSGERIERDTRRHVGERRGKPAAASRERVAEGLDHLEHPGPATEVMDGEIGPQRLGKELL